MSTSRRSVGADSPTSVSYGQEGIAEPDTVNDAEQATCPVQETRTKRNIPAFVVLPIQADNNGRVAAMCP